VTEFFRLFLGRFAGQHVDMPCLPVADGVNDIPLGDVFENVVSGFPGTLREPVRRDIQLGVEPVVLPEAFRFFIGIASDKPLPRACAVQPDGGVDGDLLAYAYHMLFELQAGTHHMGPPFNKILTNPKLVKKRQPKF